MERLNETRNQQTPIHQNLQPTYEEFQTLPDWQRMRIIAENRIINTDTYNRTMDHLRGPEGWKEQETYVLQMRRSPYGYLVAAGVEDAVAELTDTAITQEEVDFAEAFYADRNIPFFNKEMWQTVVDEHDGKLPFEIYGAVDGTVMLPGEPLLRVTGPGELIAHFEHIFHRPYYATLVATKAHEITEILGDPNRFIEVGKRGTPDEQTHLTAVKAMQIGGNITLTSNDAGAATFENVTPVGTIGHRYVQRFETVEDAFRHAIENLDAVSLLVDLVDSFQGLETALKLKQEYRDTGKKIWVRLDSGNLKEQVRFYLDACNELGYVDPLLDRITVEGFESLDDIREIEAILTDEEKKRVVYGAGGMLVSERTARGDASTGFKLAEYENTVGEMVSSMKFSNSPGKESLPGEPTVGFIDNERYIAQAYEIASGNDLLELLYNPLVRRQQTLPRDAYTRCQEQFQAIQPHLEAGNKAKISPETMRKIGEVMCRYNLQVNMNER